MTLILGILTGVVLATILGCAVGPLMRVAAPRPNAPAPFSAEQWTQLIEASGGGWIGALERYLSFGAFWTGNPSIIMGWFTLKLAAKWEAWKNVVQVPVALHPIPDLDWLLIRRVVSSHLLTRFLVGTLANALIGWAAATVGRHAAQGLAVVLASLRSAA